MRDLTERINDAAVESRSLRKDIEHFRRQNIVARTIARVFSFSRHSVFPSRAERNFMELEGLDPAHRLQAEMLPWKKEKSWSSYTTHESPRVKLPELMPDIFSFIQQNGWHRKDENYRWFSIAKDESYIDELDPETVEVSLKIFDRPNLGLALQMELYEDGAEFSTFARYVPLEALNNDGSIFFALSDVDVALLLALPGAIEEQTA